MNPAHPFDGRFNMSANESARVPQAPSRLSARLRLIGLLVLLLGLGGAGLVHWQGTRSPDLADDPAMLRYNKAATRQMGLLFGKSGVMTDELLEALKRPRVQAGILAVLSALVALACFGFASWLDSGEEPADPTGRGAS